MVVYEPLTDAELDRIFRALADSTRRDILRRTASEPMSVSMLADNYPMSFAAVQKHVAALESAGLIHKTPQGRQRLVRTDPDRLRRAGAALVDLEQQWRDRVSRLDDLELLTSMGMVEGTRSALGQLDAGLADAEGASLRGKTSVALLGDDRAVITRVLAAPLVEVWRAMHEPPLIQQWMLGPDGWSMPVCELPSEIGETYRYEWESETSGERFGFTGELVEQAAPRREVTTERMIGVDGPGTVNEIVLQPLPGGRTSASTTVTFSSAEQREMILGTGMVDGMELSYARLEALLAAE